MESKWILSLGDKFALPVDKRNFSPIHIIADIEQYVQDMSEDLEKEKEIIRTKLSNKIIQFRKRVRNTPSEKFILMAYEKTKKFLKKHKEIVITKADKGNKTVALYEEDYRTKISTLLNDKNTYRKMRIDPTTKLQKQNNSLIDNLYKNKHINQWEKNLLKCSAATAPRIYGLPKIHKPDIPLRPIISSVQIPCYSLSKYLGKILKNIISQEYNILNSIQLKERLNNLSLENDHVLFSLDVISLFTNIPTGKAIYVIMKKWNLIQKYTKIPKTTFLKILRFCLCENNYFLFENDIYSQTFDMPMGNPLSPIIANIILDDLLDEALDKLRDKNINLKYITKYVDDILAIANRNEVKDILNTFNNYHPKIQFTLEEETDKSIPFLDTKIHRENGKIIFDWYRKDTATGRIINYKSTHPKIQIFNTAKNFIHRVLFISDKKFYNKNIKHIRKTLTENSFPKNLIDTFIKKTINKINNNDYNNKINNIEKKYYSVNYIPGLTDNRNIRTTIENKDRNINFAYRPNLTVNTIFTKLKTPIEKQKQNNVVYEIKCNGKDNEECNLIYIGTTKRSLEIRINEHKQDIDKRKQTTALAQHILETNHSAELDNIKILDKEKISKKRYIIESLRIQQKKENTMNLKEDTNNISSSYTVAIMGKV